MTGDPFWQAIEAQGLDVPARVAVLQNEGRAEYNGRCDVIAAEGRWARLINRLAGFPPSGTHIALALICETVGVTRVWTRDFGGHITRSVLRFDAGTGAVHERFGPFRLRLGLSAAEGRLHVRIAHMSCLGVPVPRGLRPRSSTVEYVDEHGRFAFDVAASVPMIGPVIRYRGWLVPV